MRRRELMLLLGGAMTAGRALPAQPKAMPVIVNLQTAKTLGLTVPPSVLARATEVIERNAAS
jgi:hypothetical protein